MTSISSIKENLFESNKLIIIICLLTISSIFKTIIISIEHDKNKQLQYELNLYKDYYNKIELLLDDLEFKFNWVDAYDSDILMDYEIAYKQLNQ